MWMEMKKLLSAIIILALFVGAYRMFEYVQADELTAQCHYQIGKFKLYSLCDGHIDFPLKNIMKDDSNFDHPYLHPAEHETMQVPINIFLLDFDDQKLLVDVGLAGMFHMQTGKLPQALQAAGYQADQITGILITHFHLDHVAGLLHADGSKAFAHATLYVSQAEADYWTIDQAVQHHAETVAFMQKVFSMYPVHKFQDDEKLFDGVSVFSSAGHTDGHSGFLCDAGKDKILILGDIMQIHQIKFSHPKISILDDSDSQKAIAVRLKILEQVAVNHWIVAGVHLTSPGVGTVTKAVDWTSIDPSYTWNSLHPTC